MSFSDKNQSQKVVIQKISEFVVQARGLRLETKDGSIKVQQRVDKKSVTIKEEDLADVLYRSDETGRDFIQVNFANGLKILITENLIGFKPRLLVDLDMEKLPKVVTTPDIKSVFEAIQEVMQADDESNDEVDVLRRVFEAVVSGGEAVGFDLSAERYLLNCIPCGHLKATA